MAISGTSLTVVMSELVEQSIEREIRTIKMKAFCAEHKDAIAERNKTFVAPLVPSNYFKHPFPVINPVVTIDEKDYIIRMEQMAAIAAKRLKEPVANISDKSYDITKALDRLFSGI